MNLRKLAFNKNLFIKLMVLVIAVITVFLFVIYARGSENAFQDVEVYFTDEYGNRPVNGYFKKDQTAVLHLGRLKTEDFPSHSDKEICDITGAEKFTKYVFKPKRTEYSSGKNYFYGRNPETGEEYRFGYANEYFGSIGLSKDEPFVNRYGGYSLGSDYKTLVSKQEAYYCSGNITTPDGRLMEDAWEAKPASFFSQYNYVSGMPLLSFTNLYPYADVCSVNLYTLCGYAECKIKIDDDAPEVIVQDIENGSSNGFCNYHTILITRAEDGGVGIGNQAFSCTASGVPEYGNDTVFNITENGTYTVRVRDQLGNEFSKTIVIDNIDTTAPAISGVNVSLDSPKNGYALSSTVVVDARDEGVANLKYAFGSGDVMNDTGLSYSSDNTSVFRENGIYTVFVKDGAGNWSRTIFRVSSIDKTGPEFSEYRMVIPNKSGGYGYSVNVYPVAADICGLSDRPYDYGDGFVSEDSHTYTENGRYTIRYMDALGNISSQEIIISCIDKNPPLINRVEDITRNKIKDYSLEKTVRVVAYDSEAGLNSMAYSIDGGLTYQEDSSFTISEMGNYTVRVRDAFDNYSEYDFEIDMLDHTAPEVKAKVEPVNPVNGYSLSANVIFEADDNESGLHTEAYSFDGGKGYSAQNSICVSDNKTVCAYVRDALGNVSVFDKLVKCIDNNAPVMSISADSIHNKINTKMSLKISVKDEKSGVAAVYYTPAGSDEKILISRSSGTKDMEFEHFVYENGEYVFYTLDLLGNEEQYSYTVDVFDRDGPIIDNITDVTENDVNGYALQREIRITAHDESGLAEEAYSIDGGNNYREEGLFTISENGIYEIKVRDSLGNETVKSYSIDSIDKNEPVIGEINVVVPENTNGYGTEITLSVEAYDNEAGLSENAYSFDGGRSFTNIKEYTVSVNQILDIVVRDLLGNSMKYSYEVTRIDNVSPKMTITKKASENNQSFPVRIQVEDDMSGLGELYYKKDDMEERELLGDFEGSAKGETEMLITENGIYSFWIYDRLGNETYRVFTNNLKDVNGPVIGEISEVSSDRIRGYAREVKYIVSAVDGESELASDAYSIDGGKSWFSDPVIYFYKDGEYTLMAKDCYGNISSKRFCVDRIDREAPVIESTRIVSEQEANGYIKEGVLRIVAHDDKVGLDDAPYSFDGGAGYSADNSLKITENRNVELKVRDALGNESSKKMEIKCIDQEGPELTISGNPLYKVNGDIILQMNVRDYSAGLSSLWYMSDKVLHKIKLCDFNGETRSIQQIIISENGYYTFYAYDLLGNETVENVNVTMIEEDEGGSTPGGTGGSGSTPGETGGSGSTPGGTGGSGNISGGSGSTPGGTGGNGSTPGGTGGNGNISGGSGSTPGGTGGSGSTPGGTGGSGSTPGGTGGSGSTPGGTGGSGNISGGSGSTPGGTGGNGSTPGGTGGNGNISGGSGSTPGGTGGSGSTPGGTGGSGSTPGGTGGSGSTPSGTGGSGSTPGGTGGNGSTPGGTGGSGSISGGSGSINGEDNEEEPDDAEMLPEKKPEKKSSSSSSEKKESSSLPVNTIINITTTTKSSSSSSRNIHVNNQGNTGTNTSTGNSGNTGTNTNTGNSGNTGTNTSTGNGGNTGTNASAGNGSGTGTNSNTVTAGTNQGNKGSSSSSGNKGSSDVTTNTIKLPATSKSSSSSTGKASQLIYDSNDNSNNRITAVPDNNNLKSSSSKKNGSSSKKSESSSVKSVSSTQNSSSLTGHTVLKGENQSGNEDEDSDNNETSGKKSSSSAYNSVIIVKDINESADSDAEELEIEKHDGALTTEFVGLTEDEKTESADEEIDEDELSDEDSIFSKLFGGSNDDVDDLNMERISGELDEALSGVDDAEVDYYEEDSLKPEENKSSPAAVAAGVIAAVLLLAIVVLAILSKLGIVNMAELLSRLPFKKTKIENDMDNEVTDEISDDI